MTSTFSVRRTRTDGAIAVVDCYGDDDNRETAERIANASVMVGGFLHANVFKRINDDPEFQHVSSFSSINEPGCSDASEPPDGDG